MIVYRDYASFTVLGTEINVIAGDTSVVAEIGDKYYYVGEVIPNIDAAILAWQQANGRSLTKEEFNKVLADNSLIYNQI